MASNSKQLTVTIGAALSAGFSSVISGSTSRIKEVGSAIKDLEKQSTMSATAISGLKDKYNSLLGSLNRQQAILSKRAGYQSQIMGIVALGASLAAPIRSAMKFESAIAEVNKGVGFTAKDGIKKFSTALKELSRQIPVSIEDLGKIAAAGGQFGIGEKDILKFTENISKISVALDLTPENAVTSMSTLSNIFKIPVNELTSLGDAINHLANNCTAAGTAIVPALEKAGAAAQRFGLSAENTAALSSTLISLGSGPEAAGKAIVGITQRLQLANKMGDKVAKAFRKIGISSKVFGKMVEEDAQGALLKFLEAAGNLDEKTRTGVLYDIFGRNYSNTVATLINSMDLYKKQLDLVSDPKAYSGLMDQTFFTRAATTENSIQILKNAISELSIALGESLLPTVTSVVKSIGQAIQSLTKWISANPELTQTITHVIGGLISFRLATFAAGYAGTFLLGGLNRLVIVFKGLRLGISLVGTLFKSFLGKIFPIATVAWLVYENWETVQKFFQSIWEAVEPYWNEFKSLMDQFGVTEFITAAWEKVRNFFSTIWNAVAPGWNAFLDKIQQMGITDRIINAWKRVKEFFKTLWDSITPNFDKILKPISGLWDKFKSGVSDLTGFAPAAPKESLNLPQTSLATPEITRNQNNNFEITINAAKNDDAESISRKVVDKVSSFGETFLYDPVEGLI